MNGHNVIIYTSDDYAESAKVIEKMDKWGIDYTMKNVTDNKHYLMELQNRGIFGTPVTFVDDQHVLGYQENKLRNILNLGSEEISFFRDLYEGYEDRYES